MKLSTITNPKFYKTAAKMLLVLPIAALMHRKHSDVWLVAERPNQARDNGYCFYKYLRTAHPEIEAYYVIDKNAKDREKLEAYGNLIDFDSWKHYLYFCLSEIHISAHDDMCAPKSAPIIRLLRKRQGYQNVFLPHGVSYGISEFCLAKYGKFDLFICSGKPEYDNVLANYGYSAEQVAYTGFPRLDGWHDIQADKHQILLMPTWRAYLAQNPNTVFEETAYYHAFQALISHRALAELLQKHDLKLVFYLHNDMQKYAKAFQTDCENIEIVYSDETYDIQELLKSSALLITDYSSVHFDFAYMGKPVIYYQFDREEFFEKQYRRGMFDAAADGFGPVADDENALIEAIGRAAESGFIVEEEYNARMHNFYQLYDQNNCERVYQTIREKKWLK